MTVPEHLQIKLGGDDCTCYDIGPFMGFTFVVESHEQDEPCNAESVTITYGSNTDKQSLYDGDYIIRYAEGDIVGYPQEDFERIYDVRHIP